MKSILEGESNKEEANDKYNRVDILVSSSDGELMLVEVQNESQVDRPAFRYFQSGLRCFQTDHRIHQGRRTLQRH